MVSEVRVTSTRTTRAGIFPTTITLTLSMSLIQDFTFDSLGAVRQEIREWLGPDPTVTSAERSSTAARDVLVSVLIHNLVEELSDVRVRSQIQALLADMTQSAEARRHQRG
jgi:hypothetical protein